MTEQRRHPRAPLELAVEFSLPGQSERQAGRSRDLSLGGMFIETTRPLPFGTEVTVHVMLPDQRAPFALPGVVRWTRAEGMGVQFGMIGARETFAITALTRAP